MDRHPRGDDAARTVVPPDDLVTAATPARGAARPTPRGSVAASERPAGAPPAPPSPLGAPPTALPADAAAAAAYPETVRYRLKNRLLGSPLTTDRLAVERLGRPTALAVLSSDVISSSAYATEQALIPLVQVIGVAAFSLLVPISVAVIVVLAFVTLSYLEVVKVYTKAGGAYVVARENFGPRIAQVAAMSLLIDYTLTVAVSVAAGVAALTSVFPRLTPETTWISVVLVVVICYMNLRGVREAGRVFAVPTYFFIANMVVLIVAGAVRAITGTLGAHSMHVAGAFHIGSSGSGLFYGATLFVILRSFASGGSALTGTEAISNGVSVFRRPEAHNARITMVWMSIILGSLVLGVSTLAAISHPVPRVAGTPTVVAQIAKFVYGHGAFGNTAFVLLQASTVLILTLAANTSFTGFPYLASFAAADSYLPRQLNRRGHRLVFSTGILALTVVSILLLIITRAQVNSLIPLYAIGVFTGFTMAGFGMLRYHTTHHEPHWRRRAAINGTAGALSGVVDVIIVVTKFTEGAWAIVLILPIGFVILLRLHHQYDEEGRQLEAGALEATEAPVLRRHVVVVLIDQLDMAAAQAIQYARTLTPDDLRAVHFDIDSRATRELERDWGRMGLSRLPLDIVDCPDRRLGRAALELVADAVVDGDTECTVLLPRRGFISGWQRLLHDRTADKIAAIVSQVPHVAATIIPYNLGTSRRWARREGLAAQMAKTAIRLRRIEAGGGTDAGAVAGTGAGSAGVTDGGSAGTEGAGSPALVRPAPAALAVTAPAGPAATARAGTAPPGPATGRTPPAAGTAGAPSSSGPPAPGPAAPGPGASGPAAPGPGASGPAAGPGASGPDATPGVPDAGAALGAAAPPGQAREARETRGAKVAKQPDESAADRALARRATNTRPIAEAEWRQRVRVAGRVKSVRVQPRAGTSNLECVLADRTGGILLVFQGRPKIPGIEAGARLVAEGMVGAWGQRLAILNPDYELVAERDRDVEGPAGSA